MKYVAILLSFFFLQIACNPYHTDYGNGYYVSSDKQYGKDELVYDYQKHSNQRKEITFHEASGAERIVSADTSDLIVGMHVEAIVYDNDFILVKQKPKDKFLSHRSEDINTYEQFRYEYKVFDYWIVKKQSNDVYGPFSFEQFCQYKKQLNVPDGLSLQEGDCSVVKSTEDFLEIVGHLLFWLLLTIPLVGIVFLIRINKRKRNR